MLFLSNKLQFVAKLKLVGHQGQELISQPRAGKNHLKS
jgi:hypothetical protein